VFPQRGALPSKMLLWSSVRSPLFRFGYSALFPVEKKAFPLQWRLASSTCIYADICGRKDKHKWSSTRRFSCSVSPMTCVNLACVILLHLIRSFITAAASWHGTQIARFDHEVKPAQRPWECSRQPVHAIVLSTSLLVPSEISDFARNLQNLL